MLLHKPQPVQNIENLRSRVDRLLRSQFSGSRNSDQLPLDLHRSVRPELAITTPTTSIGDFLDFITDALPDGDVYLFGGVLRDLALLGRRGFSSDIDLVVEGQWDSCARYLDSIGAHRNKFGGYRLTVAEWPIDIWNARETWAIKQGLVPYRGVSSLIETTVLNWDAILMNWRTRQFIHRANYVESIQSRVLDIVLRENPNPLGMLVRVLRHLCLKDAKSVSTTAAEYLASCVERHSFEAVRSAELRSYGNSVIEPNVYRLFEHLSEAEEELPIRSRYISASEMLRRELGLS
jgi:hypothetical protein